MELSSKIYCYLYMGGKLIKGSNGNIEYKAKRWEDHSIECGMSYDEFVARACDKMNIHKVATFAYTLEFDLFSLQPMRTYEDFTNMVGFIDRFAHVYISTSHTNDVVETIVPKLPLSVWGGKLELIS